MGLRLLFHFAVCFSNHPFSLLYQFHPPSAFPIAVCIWISNYSSRHADCPRNVFITSLIFSFFFFSFSLRPFPRHGQWSNVYDFSSPIFFFAPLRHSVIVFAYLFRSTAGNCLSGPSRLELKSWLSVFVHGNNLWRRSHQDIFCGTLLFRFVKLMTKPVSLVCMHHKSTTLTEDWIFIQNA